MSQASRSGKDNGRRHPPTGNQGYIIPKTLVFGNGVNAQVVIDRVMKNEMIVINAQQSGLTTDADMKELALKKVITGEQYAKYLNTICDREKFVKEHVTYSNKMCSKFFEMNQDDHSPKKPPPPAGESSGEVPHHASAVKSPIDSQKTAQDRLKDVKENKLRRRQKSDRQNAKDRSIDKCVQIAKERQLKSKKEEDARKKKEAEAKKKEQDETKAAVKAAYEKQKEAAEPVSNGKTRAKRGVPSGPEVPNVARGVDLDNKRTKIPSGSNKKKCLTKFLNETIETESAPTGSGPPAGGLAGGADSAAVDSALTAPTGSGPPAGGLAGGADSAAVDSALTAPTGSGPPAGGLAGGVGQDEATGPDQFESVLPTNDPVVCASHISSKTGTYRGVCCGDPNGIIKAIEHKCSKCDGALHSIMCSYTKAPVLLCYQCSPHNQRKEIWSQREHLIKSVKPSKADVQVCASHKNIEGTVLGHCAYNCGVIKPGNSIAHCPSCMQIMHGDGECSFDKNERCFFCADPDVKDAILWARRNDGLYEYDNMPSSDESGVGMDPSEDEFELEPSKNASNAPTDDEGDVVMHEGRVPVNDGPIHPEVEVINQVEDSPSDNNSTDSDQNSYEYKGISARLLIQENPVDGPTPIVIRNFGCDDVANDIYTWETFIEVPWFSPRLTDDPENLQFLFEFGEGIIAPNDENIKLCHDRWHKNKIDTLISLERKTDGGCGQLYIASDGENAHYECFLRDIILAIAEYPSEIEVHLHLRELSYHTQRMLVINDQTWLKSRIARIDWDKTREEMEIKLKRKVTENDVQADKNSRQAGKNYVDYGLCSQRNSTPLKQWNKEAQDEGLCTPVMHNRSDEPNQKKNFNELSNLLREIKCLKWLTDKDGKYVPPISYFEDDTSAASQLQKDNVWHSYRPFLSFQRKIKLLQLCGCHGDRFNSKRKGRKIVFSFSHMLFKGVREGLIAYMREGIEICEEKLPLYKATNDRIYDLYSNTPFYLLDLVVQTWKEAETFQDPYVGFPMKRSKPNMDHTGYVQPVLHMIILLTKEFKINSVALLGICLAWIRDPGSAYYMCAAGAILLNSKNMHSKFLSLIDADPYIFSFFFVMLTDRVIEESNQKKFGDIWRLNTYVSRIYVDQDTRKVVIPKEKCRIHFGKDFNKWKDDVNYLFFVCTYVSHLFKEAPIQKDRHTVGSKVSDLLSDKMGSCGRLVVGHFITLLTILGFLPMHFKDCKRADKTSKQIKYFDLKCQLDSGLPDSQSKSLGIIESQQELDAFMKRASISLTKKIKKQVTEGRMEQVLCKLFQEHVSKRKFYELYLINQMFVKTDDLIDPNNKIELLMPTGETLPLKTPSLFGEQIPFNDDYVTFETIVNKLASNSVFPEKSFSKTSAKTLAKLIDSTYINHLKSDTVFQSLCQADNGCTLSDVVENEIPTIDYQDGIVDEIACSILTDTIGRVKKLYHQKCPIEEIVQFDVSKIPWKKKEESDTSESNSSIRKKRKRPDIPEDWRTNPNFDFNTQTIPELKDFLRQNGEKVSGRKPELVDRCRSVLSHLDGYSTDEG